MAYRGWLEDATVRIAIAGGRSTEHRIGRAGILRNPDGTESVIPPPADGTD